jgi:hypothetical protein
MSPSNDTPRRVRVERNIYRRPTGVLEVGFKDASGVQRWRTVEGGVMAARKLRDELLVGRGRGEAVAANARLRFGEAADLWLAGPVLDLRPATQAGYRSAVEQHLRPRFGNRRLDSITADELAKMVRDLRQAGKSEATIHAVLGTAGRIYKFAARRLGFSGTIPTTLMLPSERSKVSLAKRLPIFTPRADRADAGSLDPALPDAVHARRIDRRPHLGAVRPDVGGRQRQRTGRGRDHVRLPGRPARESPTHQDRRLRPDRADSVRARPRPRSAPALST